MSMRWWPIRRWAGSVRASASCSVRWSLSDARRRHRLRGLALPRRRSAALAAATPSPTTSARRRCNIRRRERRLRLGSRSSLARNSHRLEGRAIRRPRCRRSRLRRVGKSPAWPFVFCLASGKRLKPPRPRLAGGSASSVSSLPAAGCARPRPRRTRTARRWTAAAAIACCSWGVITSCWPCLSSKLCGKATSSPRTGSQKDRRINPNCRPGKPAVRLHCL